MSSHAPPLIFDAARWCARANRYYLESDSDNFLFNIIFAELQDRLSLVSRAFENTAVFSPFSFPETHKPQNLGTIFQLSPIQSEKTDMICSDEYWPFKEESLDLVIDIMGLSIANDLPGALAQIHKSLKPDGLFLSVMLGENSLTELREALFASESKMRGGASMRIHPMIELKQMGALMQRASFALPVVDLDHYELAYENYNAMMQDLLKSGLRSCLKQEKLMPLSKEILKEAELWHRENYSHRNNPDKFMLSLELIWASGWKPHESQQKPLKPGSAKISLSDVL